MRLTIQEYSKEFKMSTEMIQSKLRSKRLNYIIEDGITYIIVTRSTFSSKQNQAKSETPTEEQVTQTPQEAKVSTLPAKQKTTVAMVLGLYQKENAQLKEKIVQLEAKIDKLIDDKEQMLRDEMAKIEQVYSDKDAQLKNILELVNAKLQAEIGTTVHDVETLEVEQKAPTSKKNQEIIELKHYLKSLDLETYQKKIIKKRFLAVYGKDIRVIKQNGKLFLDFFKYDYSDLLDY